MEIAKGNLVIIDINTSTPQVFWKGNRIEGVDNLRADWDTDDQRIKIRIDGAITEQDSVLQEMVAAGILIKRV